MRKHAFMTIRSAFVGFVAFALLGCGGGGGASHKDKRFPLSGKVTLDGTPVDGGTITFQVQGENQRPAGGRILNGEYSVPEDSGANEGTYRVEIRLPKPTGKQRKDEDTGEMVDIVQEAIPKKYNDASELKAEVGPGKTEFNFDLQSK
jgi:hypothetical protein